MNSYLEPVVRELLQLWKGIEMVTPDGVQTVHAALLYTASDIPATRKLGGFVRHGALKRCSRCLNPFQLLSLEANLIIAVLIVIAGQNDVYMITEFRE